MSLVLPAQFRRQISQAFRISAITSASHSQQLPSSTRNVLQLLNSTTTLPGNPLDQLCVPLLIHHPHKTQLPLRAD
ncbi:hypothetical protein [Pseudomonas sp. CLCA07]